MGTAPSPTLYEALLLAVLSTVVVSITSILAFNDLTRAFLSPSIATIAVSFPLSLALMKPGILLSEAMKTIIACMVGCGFGGLLFTVSAALAPNSGSRAIIATLLTFPIVWGLVLADPVCKSPLVPFISPSVAIIVMYVMASFSQDKAFVTGGYMFTVYAIASVITLTVFLSVPWVVRLGSTKVYMTNSLIEFERAMAHWFEGLTAFMTSASGHHEAELNLRQEKASCALTEMRSAMSQATEMDPLAVLQNAELGENFVVTLVVLHSQLLALRGTIFHDGYSQHSLDTVLSPVRGILDKVRMTTVLALRPTTPSDIREEAIKRLSGEALELYTEFARSVSFTASLHIGASDMRDEIRLAFALTSVVRFAMLVQHLRTSVDDATRLLSPGQSFLKYMKTQLGRLFCKVAWSKTTNFRYAFRSALAQQFVAQMLLLLSKTYPSRVTSYIFWALVPVVSTFSHTVGAGLFVGSRNVAGCLLGATLGTLTAIFTAGNREAIYFEMLIVAFVSKFASNYREMNVAALTFASTWNVLSIPNMQIEDLSVLLKLVGYRISLTVLGVVASALLSLLLFPSFAADTLRKSIGRTVTTASRLVCEGIVGALDRVPISVTQSFDESSSVCCSPFSQGVTVDLFEGASSKALRTIRKHAAMISSACEEARPEIPLIDWSRRNETSIHEEMNVEMKSVGRPLVSSVNVHSLRGLIDSEPLIQKLSDSACVFSSIAASTRVLENCHAAMFSSGFVSSLHRFVDILEGGAAMIAAIVMDPKSALRLEFKLSLYTQDVTRELFGLRESLEKAGLLGTAERSGWLLIYVFHFALVEFTAAWDELVEHLEHRRRGSTASSLEETFNEGDSPTSPRRPNVASLLADDGNKSRRGSLTNSLVYNAATLSPGQQGQRKSLRTIASHARLDDISETNNENDCKPLRSHSNFS